MFLPARLAPLFALLLALSSQTSSFALGNLEEGKQFYANGRLDKAARCFSAELAEDPHDATAHYLLGNVYLALQHISSAIIEYRKCAALDAHGQAGNLSRMALASISVEGTMSREPNPLIAPAAGSVKPAGVLESTPKTGSTDTDATRNSATVISKETEERAKAAIAERDARVQRIMSEGDQRAKALEKEMYERLTYATGVSNWSPGTATVNSKVSNYAQSIRDDYMPQIDAIKRDTRRRADETIAAYHDRAAAIEDSAISLDKEYIAPGSAMKLNPLGTNTYVRSYETADEPSGGAVPVQAAPAKLLKSNETRKSVTR